MLEETPGNEFHMMRKIALAAAAVALSVGVLAGTGVAGAGGVTLDAANYSVSCSGLAATAKFSHPLTIAGVPGGGTEDEVTTIKGSVSGCTATPTTGGTAITGLTGKVSGSISDPTSDGT